MLVDADGVEAALGGVLELIHEVVVHEVGALGVEQRGMDVDPHGRMLLAEVVRQLRVRHQVKPHELHRAILPDTLSCRCPSRTLVRTYCGAKAGASME